MKETDEEVAESDCKSKESAVRWESETADETVWLSR